MNNLVRINDSSFSSSKSSDPSTGRSGGACHGFFGCIGHAFKKAVGSTVGFIKDHPTLSLGFAAVAVCLATAGIGCSVATYAVAAFGVGKSAYDNGIIGPGPARWGRFGVDVAVTGAFLGAGSVIDSVVAPAASRFFQDPVIGQHVHIYGTWLSAAYGGLIDYANGT